MRVAVVDIGTNSTRLLIADVGPDGLTELVRESTVTRLGEGVDASGALTDAAQQRVFDTLERYRATIDTHGALATPAVMTSAVRDAANGQAFAAAVRQRFDFDARTLTGDEEARLTYLGATAARDPDDPAALLVIDIGGGSTELVCGRGEQLSFHASTQAGVVRQSERHLCSDPPDPDELTRLAEDARATFAEAVPEPVRASADAAVAVAGTATSCAAIDLELDPYDPALVEGHAILLARLEELLARLAAMPLQERREVVGLAPARATTIVAGIVLLIEALRAFELDTVSVSERDILWGVALTASAAPGGRLSD